MKEQKYVCGATKAIFIQYQLNFFSSTAVAVVEPLPSILIRSSAQSFSSSVKNPAAAGVSGIKKKQMMPKRIVIAPLTGACISIVANQVMLQKRTHRRKSTAIYCIHRP